MHGPYWCIILCTGAYCYVEHLLWLDSCWWQAAHPLTEHLSIAASPLSARLPVWRARLATYPDQRFATYILQGLEQGFRVSFNYTHPLTASRRNMVSATQHPEVVERYIAGERAEGRFIGPLTQEAAQGLHVSRIGVIPKGRVPGKWRLITDLSFPEGSSVNDGIDPALCSLQYTSVEKVAAAARRLGPGALLAKVDIKSAYRLIPVHPDDRHLLGINWNGELYVDAMLPFGLRSAPKIFTAVADALEWCICKKGVHGLDHYLDDFIIVAPPASNHARIFLQLLEDECDALGVPLAPEKKEGPATSLTFLGIGIDTREGRLYLPSDKLTRLRQEVERWLPRKACCRHELESLIGVLQHAAKVIRPGRSFMRGMIDLLRGPRRPHHYIRLNQWFRADLCWWKSFAASWNGVAYFPPDESQLVEFASDASGAWGCGAWSQSQWWQFQWPVGHEHGTAFK